MAFRHFDGACVIVRLHPEHVRSPREAGLDQQVLDCLDLGKGLILVTGEAGSGITSTMATMLGEIVKKDPQLILVLDETIEYQIPTGNAVVVTRRMGTDCKDYETALSAAIHDNPDVLVVGDVSTLDRFDLALRAAGDGRLVIAALHARSIQAALRRALNFYCSYDVPRIRTMLAAVLNCMIRVQLVPDKDGVAQFLASELLVMDQAARAVVRGGPLDRLTLLLNMEGTGSGHSMDASLEDLLRRGDVTFEDAFHVADDKSRILKKFKGKAAAKS
jgi:twitching motility protein PilT